MTGRRVLSMMFALALLGAAPTFSRAADTTSLEELAAGMADTPEEHKAVAAFYRGKAEEARAEATRHRTMGKTYAGGKYVQKKAMEGHCEGLVASYESIAKQYDELAAEHEASAK